MTIAALRMAVCRRLGTPARCEGVVGGERGVAFLCKGCACVLGAVLAPLGIYSEHIYPNPNPERGQHSYLLAHVVLVGHVVKFGVGSESRVGSPSAAQPIKIVGNGASVSVLRDELSFNTRHEDPTLLR